MGGFYANPEEQYLLKRNNFSLRPLSTAGHLTLYKVFTLTWRPTAVFWFALLISIVPPRLTSSFLVVTLRAVGLVWLISVPVASLGVLVAGIAATRLVSRVRWPAVVYWTWWPFWSFVFCALAAFLAVTVGDWVWFNAFSQYIQLRRLQAYGLVDPHRVAGERMQDAGIATFNATSGVDRAKGACFVNGRTFCIAPVLRGGEVTEDSSDLPATGAYDFFVAGTDCCSCEGASLGSEFRCGAWSEPTALGGVRVLDAHDRDFYLLAAEDWSATYGKAIRHPLFFTWVKDPVEHWNSLYRTGAALVGFALATSCALTMVATLALNGVLNFLVDDGYAAPIDPPMPSSSIGRGLAKRLLPGMTEHHDNAKANQNNWAASDPKYVIL